MIAIQRNSTSHYWLPNPEFLLQGSNVLIFRFEPNSGNGRAAQCLPVEEEVTTAYTKLSFTETINPDGASGEVELEDREYILIIYQAPAYSDDTSTFTEIRRERVRCAS